MAVTERDDPHVSHFTNKSLFSFVRLVLADLQVLQVTYSTKLEKYNQYTFSKLSEFELGSICLSQQASYYHQDFQKFQAPRTDIESNGLDCALTYIRNLKLIGNINDIGECRLFGSFSKYLGKWKRDLSLSFLHFRVV